jgi:hypothetical protein
MAVFAAVTGQNSSASRGAIGAINWRNRVGAMHLICARTLVTHLFSAVTPTGLVRGAGLPSASTPGSSARRICIDTCAIRAAQRRRQHTTNVRQYTTPLPALVYQCGSEGVHARLAAAHAESGWARVQRARPANTPMATMVMAMALYHAFAHVCTCATVVYQLRLASFSGSHAARCIAAATRSENLTGNAKRRRLTTFNLK